MDLRIAASRAHRRALAVTCAIGLGSVLAVAAAAATPPFWSGPVSRLAGVDRYATAVAISQSTFATPPVPVAYVATGTNFPDALAGGPAAALEGGPVLLVPRDAIPPVVTDELHRLQPAEIVVLGGAGVVSEAVVDSLRELTPGSVTRLAGPDRYATAAQVVSAAFAGYTGPVFVAFGGNFPDALAGGAAAAVVGAPIVLATSTDVPDATALALAGLTPTRFVLLGGPAVLGGAVEAELDASHPDVPIERWAGSNRYATSARISENAFPDGAGTAFLATGRNFPDALAGVPAAGLAGGPLLLTERTCMPPVSFVELQRLDPDEVVLLGGASVVAGGAPSTVCGPDPQPSADVDCMIHFTTQPQAQGWFDYYEPWFGDIAGLDRDNDGLACEDLPPS